MKMMMRLNLCFHIPTSVSPASSNILSPPSFDSSSSSPDENCPATAAAGLYSDLSLQSYPSIPSLQLQTPIPPPSPSSFSSSRRLPHPISFLALYGPFLYAAAGPQVHVFDSSSSTLTYLHFFPSYSSAAAAVIKSVSFTTHRHNSSNHVITAHQDGKIRVWLQPDLHEGSTTTTNYHRLVNVLPTALDLLRRFALPRNYVQVRRHKHRLWIHHNDAVSALAVRNSTDDAGGGGDLVYSVSWDKSLKIWRRGSDFKCVESVTAHEDAVNAVAVSSEGVVYTGSADGRIRVWAKREGEERSKHVLVATLEKHRSAVNALALMTSSSSTSTSTLLFSGACDRSILVWEREEDTGSYMVVAGALRGHRRSVLCLVTVRDVLISGSADGTVRMWRRDQLLGMEPKFCCLAVLDAHLKPVKSLAATTAVTTCGDQERQVAFSVFSGSLDGEIRLWRVNVLSV